MFPNVAGKVSKIRTENYLVFRFHNLWVMNGFTRTVPIKLGDKSPRWIRKRMEERDVETVSGDNSAK